MVRYTYENQLRRLVDQLTTTPVSDFLHIQKEASVANTRAYQLRILDHVHGGVGIAS